DVLLAGVRLRQCDHHRLAPPVDLVVGGQLHDQAPAHRRDDGWRNWRDRGRNRGQQDLSFQRFQHETSRASHSRIPFLVLTDHCFLQRLDESSFCTLYRFFQESRPEEPSRVHAGLKDRVAGLLLGSTTKYTKHTKNLRVASWKFLNRLRWMDSITVRNSRGINGRFTRSRLHSGHHRGQHGSSSRQIKRDHLRRLSGLEPERGLLPSGRPLTPGVRSALAWLKGVRPGSERGLSRPSRRSRTELILSRNAPSRPAGCSTGRRERPTLEIDLGNTGQRWIWSRAWILLGPTLGRAVCRPCKGHHGAVGVGRVCGPVPGPSARIPGSLAAAGRPAASE